MSLEHLAEFEKRVKEDSSLQEKLKDAKCEGCVISVAEDEGLTITEEEVKGLVTDSENQSGMNAILEYWNGQR